MKVQNTSPYAAYTVTSVRGHREHPSFGNPSKTREKGFEHKKGTGIETQKTGSKTHRRDEWISGGDLAHTVSNKRKLELYYRDRGLDISPKTGLYTHRENTIRPESITQKGISKQNIHPTGNKDYSMEHSHLQGLNKNSIQESSKHFSKHPFKNVDGQWNKAYLLDLVLRTSGTVQSSIHSAVYEYWQEQLEGQAAHYEHFVHENKDHEKWNNTAQDDEAIDAHVPEYWNIENTSERIAGFAISFFRVSSSMYGNEEEEQSAREAFSEKMISAVTKGYDMALKSFKEKWGEQSIPPKAFELVEHTYKRTVEKLEAWGQGTPLQEEKPLSEGETI